MPRTTNAAGRIRDESLMNLGGRGNGKAYTSKIQPTTSPPFVFSVPACVRKKWGYERKLLTVILVVVHPVFLFSFYYFTQKV
jgi:hypothetical protein